MKKIFVASAVCIALLKPAVSNAQLEKGNVIIDAYYGFPNLYTSIFKTSYANSGQEMDLRIGGVGPLGGRVEYLLSDNIGFGVDVGFNNTTVQYSEQGINQVYDPNTGTTTNVPYFYDYNLSTKKIGVIATFNYHFVQTEELDAYATIGGGYGNRSFAFETNDPSFTEGDISGVIPFSGKIGVGMRYFFTSNIGANFAVGFGQGGLVNVGLSAKF
jgi:hypothetical protein